MYRDLVILRSRVPDNRTVRKYRQDVGDEAFPCLQVGLTVLVRDLAFSSGIYPPIVFGQSSILPELMRACKHGRNGTQLCQPDNRAVETIPPFVIIEVDEEDC